MKYKIILLLTVILVLSGCNMQPISIEKLPTAIEELQELGYSKTQIEKLKDKLTEEQLDIITEHDYIEIILDIVNDEEFKIENLKKYLEYYELGMNGSAIVYIVNNNITYTYNEKLVSIMNHPYFIAKNLDRYMKYESDEIDTIITLVNTNRDRDYYTDIQKTDTSKEKLLLVNKYYALENNYVYGKLVTMSTRYSNRSGQKLNEVAYDAFKKLVEAGEENSVYFRNLSAYRSYSIQKNIYENYKKQNGQTWTDKWSARPGHSEHQTGLALDVAVKGKGSFDGFENTKEFAWLEDNAHLYGFVLRYPKDKTNITGYGYEPWHYRYVGVDVATYIYEKDITYEEYYAYFIENQK